MDINTYRDKVRGCWLGKNIGGTLGAPFECLRGVYDLDFYTQDMSGGALPNDDLDLQLVWLNAAEKYGRAVGASILGEYWLSFVVANWSEYGAGKNNLANGVVPPLSGSYHNHNRSSCGAFIRSELWACLLPGHPELAVRYALEDASVDHSGEGVYAEIFCAAVESAAFAESDRDTLLDIGLSYLPEDCAVALAVNTARACHRSGLTWKEARKKILQTVPGSMGQISGYRDQEPEPDIPQGEPGYDAPSNIGIMVLGWLYGEGDFGRSLCIAAGCCEDADCTAATLGSILGILSGAAGLPEKWLAPIGEDIKTVSIDRTWGAAAIPDTIGQLTDRVCRLAPVFLREHCDVLDPAGVQLRLHSGQQLFCRRERLGHFGSVEFREELARRLQGPSRSNVLFTVTAGLPDGINVKEGQPVRLRFHFTNNQRRQQWITGRWVLPKGWKASTGKEFSFNLDQPHGGYAIAEFEAELLPPELNKGRYEIVLELTSRGRALREFLCFTLINSAIVTR